MPASQITTRMEIKIDRLWNHERVEVTGIAGTLPLAFLLSQISSERLKEKSHLVITATFEQAERLYNDLAFFDPESHLYTSLLTGFDVSPVSGITMSRRSIGERLSWFHKARQATGGEVFIASVEHLLQKTMPVKTFKSLTLQLERGSELTPEFFRQLQSMGYQSTSLVEDLGTFSQRGNIVDIFSPAHPNPIRLELFGDFVEAIKVFNPSDQRSLDQINRATIVPASEVILTDETKELFVQGLSKAPELQEIPQWKHSVFADQHFQGIENLTPLFYSELSAPSDYFVYPPAVWVLDQVECIKSMDSVYAQLKQDIKDHNWETLSIDSYYGRFEDLSQRFKPTVFVDPIPLSEDVEKDYVAAYSTRKVVLPPMSGAKNATALVQQFLEGYKKEDFSVFISSPSVNQAQRLAKQIETIHFEPKIIQEPPYLWSDWINEQAQNPKLIHILCSNFSESLVLPEEKLVFLKEREILEKSKRTKRSTPTDFNEVKAINFGDLKTGDPIVHNLHGVGVYEGLKVLDVDGHRAEYLQIRYKDSDRLYVPVYKLSLVHKFSAPFSVHMIDKLGGTGWEKAKIKVRHHLREVAADLLRLYALRNQVERPTYEIPEDDFHQFETEFPFEETDDQLKAIDSILKDFQNPRPMDRLVCGDVGFGKTEIAMRAAFLAVQSGQQVAVLVPTTTLAFQHDENFRKRFKKWPVSVASYSRFTTTKEAKEALAKLKEGKLDVLIGTHRLFGRDVEFKNLGLLIVDEEQRFGVLHKEKIKQLKATVDTLTLSATPIPRTLNMSFMGVRDLSLINTPPQDRLPIRTFVMKFNKEVIKKAVDAEVKRGGQVLFVHNRVQSIYEMENQLKDLLPGVRIRVGHGQMKEEDLEDVILAFFRHEFDVLLCTTIIESGMDIPRTNTILIDRSDTFGLSQLYQLRGRVGRGTERAYCYLFVPPHGVDAEAQERLKVLQDNTNLGSGLRIAQYDLELRGAGDILGESQSGHANAVGYDLYMELLQEALSEAKGETKTQPLPEPEVNLKIAAFIPDSYMPDIRLRLAFYKLISDAKTTTDLDRIEMDLGDRFGPPPQEVLNLMGVVLVKNTARDMGIRDINMGPKNLAVTFTENVGIDPEKVIRLATLKPQKYKLQPNSRILIRTDEKDWASIHQELLNLK